MKLYYHPVSTTSRPLMLYVQENGLDVQIPWPTVFQLCHFKVLDRIEESGTRKNRASSEFIQFGEIILNDALLVRYDNITKADVLVGFADMRYTSRNSHHNDIID